MITPQQILLVKHLKLFVASYPGYLTSQDESCQCTIRLLIPHAVSSGKAGRPILDEEHNNLGNGWIH